MVWPGTQQLLVLGPLDHRIRNAILDAAGGILPFELGVEPHARLGGEMRDFDQGSIADEVQNAAGYHGLTDSRCRVSSLPFILPQGLRCSTDLPAPLAAGAASGHCRED